MRCIDPWYRKLQSRGACPEVTSGKRVKGGKSLDGYALRPKMRKIFDGDSAQLNWSFSGSVCLAGLPPTYSGTPCATKMDQASVIQAFYRKYVRSAIHQTSGEAWVNPSGVQFIKLKNLGQAATIP